MAAHRYWRLFTRFGSSDAVLIAEVELRTSSGGADATGSGTASASSVDGTNTAAKVFDNSTSTFWQSTFGSGSVGVWLEYDFGSGNDKDIVEVALTPSASFANRMPQEFDIQWSDDNATWTTAWSASFPTWTSAQQVFTKPSAVASRYWRVRGNVYQSGSTIMGCAEIEMRSTNGGADETGSGTPGSRSTAGGTTAANAFDNNTSTEYASLTAAQSEWLSYDFGSGVTKDIQEIAWTARVTGGINNPDQGPVSGWVESSTDGKSWLSRWTFSGKSYSSLATTIISANPTVAARRRQLINC
jgi:hypothetical protein